MLVAVVRLFSVSSSRFARFREKMFNECFLSPLHRSLGCVLVHVQAERQTFS